MSQSIRIAIAEDQALFRKTLANLLNSIQKFEVVIEASNGQELIDQLSTNSKVDVILMDLRMPVLDGIATSQIIKEEYPQLKIIVVSVHDDHDIVEHLFEIGVNSYLDKNAEPEELKKAIEQVMAYDFYFDSASKKMLKENAGKLNSTSSIFFQEKLSKRETEILQYICKEYTNTEIAEQLNISNRTVDTHRQRLLQKSKARNTAGLVLYALKNELIKVSELKIS